jgi:hypothetical protein
LLLDGKLENNPLLVATPGLWAEYNLKNDWIIYGEILPLSQLFYGSKPIFDSLYKSNSNDSSLILNKVNLVKSIHTSFSFGIQKRLVKSLTLGLTAGMNFNHSLLLNRNITFINSGQTLSDSIWAQKPIKNKTYPTRKVVMYSSLFVNYKVSKFSFSLGLTLPLTGIILQNKSYPIYPNFLFNLKYTLFGN